MAQSLERGLEKVLGCVFDLSSPLEYEAAPLPTADIEIIEISDTSSPPPIRRRRTRAPRPEAESVDDDVQILSSSGPIYPSSHLFLALLGRGLSPYLRGDSPSSSVDHLPPPRTLGAHTSPLVGQADGGRYKFHLFFF